MPQTLFGLLALALASLLTVNSQQHRMGTYQDRLVDEYRLAASGMATHVMEIIASRSFDEASTPLAIEARDSGGGSILPDSTLFTAASDFGESVESSDRAMGLDSEVLERILGNRGRHTGFYRRYENEEVGCDLLTHSPACDDVDDVAGLRGESVFVEFSNGGRLEFLMSIDVYYVQKSAPEVPVTTPTRHKRVIVQIEAPDLPKLGTLVQLERVVSYDPIKADRDHERLCGTVNGVDNLDACIDGYVNS